MKVYETNVTCYTPKKVKNLSMSKHGFPLVNGEPQDMNGNTIYDLDGVFYLYDGEDDWSKAIDGIHYSSKKEVLDIIKINQEYYGNN